jgi:hypothetical protein
LTETQAQNLVQQISGALTGNVTVLAPAVGAFYAVENATTGNFTLSFGCLGGANAQIIPQGLSTWLWTDGSFTRLSNPPGWQEIATYTANSVPQLTVLLPAPFRRFRLTLQNGSMSVAGGMIFQASNNGGASFANSGYVYTAFGYTTTGTNPTNFNTSSAAMPFTAASLPGPTTAIDSTMEIWPGIAPNIGFVARGNNFVIGSTGWQQTYQQGSGGTGGVNAVSLIANGGVFSGSIGGPATFSGTIIVEGLP